MATAQTLKKKLRGVQSIRKVSKALKTASTVKFSKLGAVHSNYKVYAEKCFNLYENNYSLFKKSIEPSNKEAPHCFVVMAGNKGMCGTFNSDLLNFAMSELKKSENFLVILCGAQSKMWFDDRKMPYCKSFVFDDIPTYENAEMLLDTLCGMLKNGEISGFELIYPSYKNMLNQTPCRCSVAGEREEKEGVLPLFLPDRESVVSGMAKNVLTAFMYEKILECALGAQAATLISMRSSYDTATEYCAELESEINRIRQKRVTADVIETSSELSRKVE